MDKSSFYVGVSGRVNNPPHPSARYSFTAALVIHSLVSFIVIKQSFRKQTAKNNGNELLLSEANV